MALVSRLIEKNPTKFADSIKKMVNNFELPMLDIQILYCRLDMDIYIGIKRRRPIRIRCYLDSKIKYASHNIDMRGLTEVEFKNKLALILSKEFNTKC